MRHAIALLLTTGLIAGCASQGGHPQSVKEYTYDPSASLAKNVVDAAGIDGLEDLPREDYEALVDENPELRGIDPRGAGSGSDAANTLGGTAAGVAGAMDPIAGLGGLGTGALGALSWLADGNSENADLNWMIVWLPEDKTLDEFERDIAYAYTQAFGFGPENTKAVYFDGMFKKDQLAIVPSDCPMDGGKVDRSCAIIQRLVEYQRHPDQRRVERSDFVMPEVTETPDFIEHPEEARGPILITDHVYYPGAEGDPFSEEILKRYRENLPGYVYYYLASVEGAPVTPRVEHEGESHFFIEP